MALFYVTKQPSEEKTFRVDKSGFREIQEGEIITSIAVTCTLDGVDVTGDIIVSSSHTDDTADFRVKEGEDGRNYHIRILATTDAGHIRESDIVLQVRETP